MTMAPFMQPSPLFQDQSGTSLFEDPESEDLYGALSNDADETQPSEVSSGPSDYAGQARAAAQSYGLDPDLFLRLIGQESGFSPSALSSAGAKGIAQFMPETGDAVAKALGIEPSDFWSDPGLQLKGAAKHLSDLISANGSSTGRGLIAYNGGQGALQAADGGHPYAESIRYARSILGGGGTGESDDDWWRKHSSEVLGTGPGPSEDGGVEIVPPPVASRIPSIAAALNDAAQRSVGVSWDAMTKGEQQDFRLFYELLDRTAVAQFGKGYRQLSGGQRDQLKDVLSTAATIMSLAQQFRLGALDEDGLQSALIRIGVDPSAVGSLVSGLHRSASTKLINAVAARFHEDFLNGDIDGNEYLNRLIQGGVPKDIAAQLVAHDQALQTHNLSIGVQAAAKQRWLSEFMEGRLTTDDYKKGLLDAGVPEKIADQLVAHGVALLGAKDASVLSSAARGRWAAEFRAGTATPDDYKAGLVAAGVKPPVADQIVASAVADERYRAQRAMGRAAAAEPRPLPVSSTRGPPGLTWARAAAVLGDDSLSSLTDAWAGGGDGIGALSQQQWREVMNMLPVTSSVPALAGVLHHLWASAGGGRIGASRPQRLANPSRLLYPPGYFRTPRQPRVRR